MACNSCSFHIIFTFLFNLHSIYLENRWTRNADFIYLKEDHIEFINLLHLTLLFYIYMYIYISGLKNYEQRFVALYRRH